MSIDRRESDHLAKRLERGWQLIEQGKGDREKMEERWLELLKQYEQAYDRETYLMELKKDA